MRRWIQLPAAALIAAAGLAFLGSDSSPATATAAAQITSLPLDEGPNGLGLALRQLPVEGAVLYVTAHPDDENNGVLVALNRGRGLKTSLLTTTRGDGGQNEIGPELFQAIGILRTEELAAVHRFDNADQYFTRAFEFGYSFSVEETLEKWGKEAILADVVRVIRKVRPDVILTMNPQGTGGGQHHQTSARLAHEAFRAAADPARFPEQIAEGLRPWQARKVYQAGGFGGGAAADGARPVSVPTGQFDPLLGMSWGQLGSLARSQHLCQGMGQLESFPGDSSGNYTLRDSEPSVSGTETDIMDGIDTSLGRLSRFANGEATAVPSLAADLAAITSAAEAAGAAFDLRAPEHTLPFLADGLGRVRALLATVEASSLSAAPRAELLWRLGRKAEDFERAIELAQGIVVRVLAGDGNVVRGQSFDVLAQVFNTGTEPVSVDGIDLSVPSGWTATQVDGTTGPLAYNESTAIRFRVTVGPSARYSQPYWKYQPGVARYDIEIPEDHTLPWSPPDVTATVRYRAAGLESSLSRPAYYRYEGPWVGGEKQKVVNIVPVVSVEMSPGTAVVPLDAAGDPREFRVTVRNNAPTGGSTTVRLEAPAGWTVEPAATTIEFSLEEEEMTTRFFVTPPAGLKAGTVEIKGVATRDGIDYREGYQLISYNHIQPRHLYHPAVSTVEVFDVSLPDGLQVGYVMGSGDEVPDALRQLGATVTMLEADDVAFGDLSRYDTIVLGIRAYEKRADLRAYNQRLFDYARNGGHLVVQYNKTPMNQLGAGAAGGRGLAAPGGGGRGRGRGAPAVSPYVPYPAAITSDRVTVEETPITILQPEAPLLTAPNRITATDFDGWVQERGLYFFGAAAPEYTELLAATDPWPYNEGEKRGMLTTAQIGQGTWTYVGIGLWRQLSAGVPGAHRIMANLVAQGQTR